MVQNLDGGLPNTALLKKVDPLKYLKHFSVVERFIDSKM